MRNIMMHTVLFLLLGAVARADVLVLTTKSMESELSSAKGATFVKFYAPCDAITWPNALESCPSWP